MPAKKIIADDDEVVVKKAKKVVADDDDEVVTKKSAKKAAIDDEAPVPKKTEAAAVSAAPRRAAAEGIKLATSATTASEKDAWVAPNYDDMTFEDFKKLLAAIPMSIAMAQKSAFDNQLIAADAENAKKQIEAFMDGTEGGFQYNDMLSRATNLMQERGIGENSRSRSIEIPPPQMEKIGTKRIAIANFEAICAAINRPVTDAQKYFERQTSATTSLDGNNALILKMKLDGKGVERIFDKYLSEWITCGVCKSIDTTVEKEKNVNRLFVVRCNKCKAFRHVEMSETAFAANTTKRSKLRNAGLL